jgi:hypothetical protein
LGFNNCRWLRLGHRVCRGACCIEGNFPMTDTYTALERYNVSVKWKAPNGDALPMPLVTFDLVSDGCWTSYPEAAEAITKLQSQLAEARAEALEEAAARADRFDAPHLNGAGERIAQAIRALKDQSHDD